VSSTVYLVDLKGDKDDDRAKICAKDSTIRHSPVTRTASGGTALVFTALTGVFAAIMVSGFHSHITHRWIIGMTISIITMLVTIISTAVFLLSDTLSQFDRVVKIDDRMVEAFRTVYRKSELGPLDAETLWEAMQAHADKIIALQADLRPALEHTNPTAEFNASIIARFSDVSEEICGQLSEDRVVKEAGLRAALPLDTPKPELED